MNVIHGCLVTVFCLLSLGLPNTLSAASPEKPAMQEVSTLLAEHTRELSRDLRQIRREIAALRAEMSRPGIREVFTGVGYIFGLFGVAAFVAARRRE